MAIDKEQSYKALNEQARLENQRLSMEFNKQVKETADGLGEGEGLQKDVAAVLKSEVRKYSSLHDSFKTSSGKAPSVKDKDGITDVYNKVSAVEKEIVNARTLFGSAIMPSPAMSLEAKQIYASCLRSDDYDNVKPIWKDNKLHFQISTPDSTSIYSLSDLQENFIPEATEAETMILQSGISMRELGYKEGGEVTESMLQSEADKLTSEIEKDPKIVADLSVRRLAGRSSKKPKNDSGLWPAGSWASALQDHPSLNMAVYKTAGVNADINGDGDVSQAEAEAVMNGPNRDKVIETLVNPKAKGYNHALSSSELASWISNQHAEMYYEGKNAKNNEYKNNSNTLNLLPNPLENIEVIPDELTAEEIIKKFS